jgi:hypothetical protein
MPQLFDLLFASDEERRALGQMYQRAQGLIDALGGTSYRVNMDTPVNLSCDYGFPTGSDTKLANKRFVDWIVRHLSKPLHV